MDTLLAPATFRPKSARLHVFPTLLPAFPVSLYLHKAAAYTPASQSVLTFIFRQSRHALDSSPLFSTHMPPRMHRALVAVPQHCTCIATVDISPDGFPRDAQCLQYTAH